MFLIVPVPGHFLHFTFGTHRQILVLTLSVLGHCLLLSNLLCKSTIYKSMPKRVKFLIVI